MRTRRPARLLRLDGAPPAADCRHLKDPPFIPRTLWDAAHHDTSVFDDIREQDRLLHHPFDSFSAVETFVSQAVADPHVVAIKMTLYRIGQDSPLIRPAHRGRRGRQAGRGAGRAEGAVRRAEQHPVGDAAGGCRRARRLRRREPEDPLQALPGGAQARSTACAATSTSAPATTTARTAQVYTDFGLFTADPELVADVSEVFNYLTGYSKRTDYRQLLVAPVSLRAGFASADRARDRSTRREGRPRTSSSRTTRITDPAIVRALYRASRAGVEHRSDRARRVLRCKPGVPGVSERIRVRSVVGRFLEHSRVYWFANGGRDDLYLGSADLMERNLDRRVEAVCRVRDEGDRPSHSRRRAGRLSERLRCRVSAGRPSIRALDVFGCCAARQRAAGTAGVVHLTAGVDRGGRVRPIPDGAGQTGAVPVFRRRSTVVAIAAT